jgi:hypothetical protein
METTGKVVIAAAVIGAIATIASALISKGPSTNGHPPPPPPPTTCPSIPPVSAQSPPPKDGYVWVPAYVDWVHNEFKVTAGHWERRRADGTSPVRIPGYWDTSQQRCVWIPSRLQ